MWTDVRFFSFWIAKQAENKIVFLPESANGIAVLDTQSGSVGVLNIPYKTDSLCRYNDYSAIDMVDINNMHLFIPHRNNSIIIADHDLSSVEHRLATIRLSELSNTQFISLSEQTSNDDEILESYLSSLDCLSKNTAKECGVKIGEKIYNYLMGETND